jgi:FkbM family methyltransferase
MNIVSHIKRLFRPKAQELAESCSTRSYSQCGEDIIVDYIFRLRGVERPSFIDVGAHHPFSLNNTARFYGRGCRGVSIEPNPAAIQLFNEYRKEDINLNIGISNEGGTADFFMMEDSTLSTFSEAERDKMVSHGQRVAGVTKVKMMPLPAVIEQFCCDSFPDFMSLDVEGMELPILRSIDFDKHCPKIICVEIADYSPIGAGRRRTELVEVLHDRGYYEYANTNLNAILVQNQFWFGPAAKK